MSYRAVLQLESMSLLTQSRLHGIDREDGESHEDLDKRTWREKLSYNPETDHIYLPNMAFKQAIDTAAKRLDIPDPDNKKARMAKFFTTDCSCFENVPLYNKNNKPWMKNDAGFRVISAHSNGKRGPGPRVPRTLPEISGWKGTLVLDITDEKIKPDMLLKVVEYAGKSIGVGQFRPENGGTNGRFRIVTHEIQREEEPVKKVAVGGRR